MTALYPGSHQGLGGQYLIPSHLSEEGLQVAILVVAQVPGMTAEEDTALVEALDLEGSPPAGGRIRMAGPTVDGWRIVSLWD